MARPLDPLSTPRSARRYRIALTPLADAMFQLLIYFMLSTSIIPYSLLSVTSGNLASGAGEGNPEQAGDVSGAAGAALWSVGEREVIVGGQRFEMSQLTGLTAALVAAQTTRVVLTVQPDADVQDLTSVLEALATAGIVEVLLSRIGTGG
jgi:biopolymer transport protein ExbD